MFHRVLLFALLLSAISNAQEASKPIPADLPVKVFILAGQSNMQGQGVVDLDHPKYYNGGRGILETLMSDPKKGKRFAHLKTDDGKWVERDDVWIRYKTKDATKNGPLTIGFTGYGEKHHIGPELQFGHVVGDAIENPVVLIKTAWGGKSLHKDFRPPSAEGDTGPYYTQMVDEVREALDRLANENSAAKDREVEIAGFVWFQGWNDMFDAAANADYEQNLVHLIQDVRKEFKHPQLPFVVGELGNGGQKCSDKMTNIREAQRAAVDRDEFRQNAVFVPTARFARPADQSPNVGHGHHWFGNAESYFLVGDALGHAMLGLVEGDVKVIKDIRYKPLDGLSPTEFNRCRLDLYIPKAKNPPVLVWFHGGGLTGGSKDVDEAIVVGERLASEGTLVVMVNYRLSPTAKFPGYIEDSAASVAWTLKNIAKYGGDAKRVFVGGHSAGAYLTMMVGLDEQYLAAHDVSTSDIMGTIPVSAQVDSHWTVRAERGIGRDTQVIDESAPLTHVRKDVPPMLLILAEDDLKGRDELNRTFRDKMIAVGHPDTQYYNIRDRNHGSLIKRMDEADDVVSKLILNFIGNR